MGAALCLRRRGRRRGRRCSPAGRNGWSPRRPRRRPSSPSPSLEARKSARFFTRAIATCSTAPALALHTAGVTSAERRSGMITAVAPAASAVRQTAPRFCGSVISSSATNSGLGRRRQQLVRVRVGIRVDERGDALVRVALGPLLDLLDGRDRDLVRRPVLGVRRPDPVDLALAAQGLPHGVAPVDDHPPRRDRALGDRTRATRGAFPGPSPPRAAAPRPGPSSTNAGPPGRGPPPLREAPPPRWPPPYPRSPRAPPGPPPSPARPGSPPLQEPPPREPPPLQPSSPPLRAAATAPAALAAATASAGTPRAATGATAISATAPAAAAAAA